MNAMTMREWQALSPEEAAREVYQRVQRHLSSAQRRAVIADLPAEPSLAAGLAAAKTQAYAPLAGVPYFAKDLFDRAGTPTRAGSTFLDEVRPTPARDSSLLRAAAEAGLVFAGKTHLHEFAYGITGENPHYGDCEHPRFPGRSTGGSSSGSAAIVAAGIAPFAFGTDTGGSIRVPAAFCGLYGFRHVPHHAWIRDGFPLAPSFDTAGWFTATAADMALSLTAFLGLRKSNGGQSRGCYIDMPGVDADVAQTLRKAAEAFAPPADDTTRAELIAGFGPALHAYNTIVALEAWEVHRAWAERFHDRYDPAVWARLNRVHTVSPEDRRRAEATREAIGSLWSQFFRTYDFLVLPATPCPALTKAECTLENRTRLLTLTAPASIGQLPALTVPIELPTGLTSGLQIIVREPRSPLMLELLSRAAK